jgi:hypothetical protein
MTDVMNEIIKTNEEAESIQKRKNTRRKIINRPNQFAKQEK